MSRVNIGLIGFGTIGSGVYSLLQKNGNLIKERSGFDVTIKAICDLRIDEIKDKVKDIHLTNDWKEIINDKEIDTVIELIGGIEPAKTIVLEALNNGKNVVTANKKLLAEEGEDIFETAGNQKPNIGYEAAVGGGMPCIQALRDGLVGNSLNAVMGILNGTTNYILTMMEDEGLSFEKALEDAQEKGFAEADPSFDIEGFDAAHKIKLLSQMAFNRKIDFQSIFIEGITKISDIDIVYAREMGFAIKLLGVGKLIGDEVEIFVQPAMLPIKHPLASVRSEFNAVMYNGDMTGPIILYGKGAGSLPTASAVISDVIQIARNGEPIGNAMNFPSITKYLQPADKLYRYYLRFSTEDSPGILSKISGVLAKYDISIESVIQKAGDLNYVPVIIMTHICSEQGIQQSIKEINAFDFIEHDVTLIKVEECQQIEDSDE